MTGTYLGSRFRTHLNPVSQQPVRPRRIPLNSLLSALLLISLLATHASAEDLFRFDATTISGSPVSVSGTGSNLVALTQNLIQTEDQFTTLATRGFVSSLTYAGIPNAINFSVNPAGTQATLNIPSTGFTKNFLANNRDDLEDQIEDFLKKEGSNEWAKFLDTVNETSPVAAIDGNPHAATAFLADQAFGRFAMHPLVSLAGPDADLKGPASPIRVDASGGTIDANDIGDGYHAELALVLGALFTDHLGVTLTVPLMYRSIEGSDVFTGGIELGLPILLAAPRGKTGLEWQVTPFFSGGISGSEDFVAGALMLGGGISNHLGIRIGDFTVAMGNQISIYQGQDITVGDYEFDTEVDQQILKNGGQVTWSPSASLFFDAGVAYTNFLQEAAIDNYWTPGAGMGFRFSDRAGLRLGYSADLGEDYTAHNGTATLYFAF